ncbi:MAG: hypothetical protein RR704_19195 [Stenotrophomonas sp.]
MTRSLAQLPPFEFMLHYLDAPEDGHWNEYTCELIALRVVSAFQPADWQRLR